MASSFAATFWAHLNSFGVRDVSVCNYCCDRPTQRIQPTGIDALFADELDDIAQPTTTTDQRECMECRGSQHTVDGKFIYDETLIGSFVDIQSSAAADVAPIVKTLQNDRHDTQRTFSETPSSSPTYLLLSSPDDLCRAARRGREPPPLMPNFNKAFAAARNKLRTQNQQRNIEAAKKRTRTFIYEHFTQLTLIKADITCVDVSLSRFTQLTQLNLSHNEITVFDLSCLPAACTQLNLSHNRLINIIMSSTKLASVTNNNNLTSLDISYNKLTSLGALSNNNNNDIMKLKELNISYNHITDLSQLTLTENGLSSLKYLLTLNLIANPICLLFAYKVAIMLAAPWLKRLDDVDIMIDDEEIAFKESLLLSKESGVNESKENTETQLSPIQTRPTSSQRSALVTPKTPKSAGKASKPVKKTAAMMAEEAEAAARLEAAERERDRELKQRRFEWAFVVDDQSANEPVNFSLEIVSIHGLPRPTPGGVVVRPDTENLKSARGKKDKPKDSKSKGKDDGQSTNSAVSRVETTEEKRNEANELISSTATVKTTSLSYYFAYRLDSAVLYESAPVDYSESATSLSSDNSGGPTGSMTYHYVNKLSFMPTPVWSELLSKHGIDFLLYQRTAETVEIAVSTPIQQPPPTPSTKKPAKGSDHWKRGRARYDDDDDDDDDD